MICFIIQIKHSLKEKMDSLNILEISSIRTIIRTSTTIILILRAPIRDKLRFVLPPEFITKMIVESSKNHPVHLQFRIMVRRLVIFGTLFNLLIYHRFKKIASRRT